MELTNIIALENLRSRFNIAFDMDPAGFSEGSGLHRAGVAPVGAQRA